jgi:hypothetical protein
VADTKTIARRILLAALPFFTGVAVALTLFACCCPKGTPASPKLEPLPPPPVGLAQFPVPPEAEPPMHTRAEMHNVHFHVDQTIALDIETLRGEMFDRTEGKPLNFDDKRSFIVKIHDGRIGLTAASLTDLLNHYVFSYEGTPLRDLRVEVHERRMVLHGIMHKVLDIPFEMSSDVTVEDDGWMRIHPIDMRICDLNGKALMKAFGITLDEILKKLPKGVRVEKNDMLIDPLEILPPPTIQGQLTDIELHENQLLQIFSSNTSIEPMPSPFPQEKNWMLYRGGTLRMGKLFMVRADMFVADTDPSDPFDFFVDFYNAELTEGFTRNLPNYGLEVFMRDYEDVGKPRRAGERAAED